MSDLADVEICRLQEEVRALRAHSERLTAERDRWWERFQHLRAEIERLKAAFKRFADTHKDPKATATQVNAAWAEAENVFGCVRALEQGK